ncbi:hypothetical protein NQ318_011352 [Aromia moschata]|uniref:Uncharacterized protein n=1 Tax=Aromia moschata TaxID=1265417 RepID=A0AAV8XFB7_9CUCU|nr:hypothetical protein NQ318_011352 [Aromia moschata]
MGPHTKMRDRSRSPYKNKSKKNERYTAKSRSRSRSRSRTPKHRSKSVRKHKERSGSPNNYDSRGKHDYKMEHQSMNGLSRHSMDGKRFEDRDRRHSYNDYKSREMHKKVCEDEFMESRRQQREIIGMRECLNIWGKSPEPEESGLEEEEHEKQSHTEKKSKKKKGKTKKREEAQEGQETQKGKEEEKEEEGFV